jgi:hypothetical protein
MVLMQGLDRLKRPAEFYREVLSDGAEEGSHSMDRSHSYHHYPHEARIVHRKRVYYRFPSKWYKS